MTPPRRGDSGRARTAADRERDRLERERRRARERGASSPAQDPRFDVERAGLEPPAAEEPWSPAPEHPALDHLTPERGVPAGRSRDAGPTPGAPGHEPADPGTHRPDGLAGGGPGRPDPLEDTGVLQPDWFDAPAADGDDPAAQRTGPLAADSGLRRADPEEDPGVPHRATRRSRREDIPPGRGAPAALAGAATAGLARAQKLLARPPRGRGAPAEPGTDSLPPRPRARTDRGPARPPVRVRPRTASMSRTARNPDQPRSRRGRIAAVIALVAVVFALWFLFSLFQPFKGAGSGSLSVDIPKGASSSTIGTLLADRGVISSAFFFKLRATLAGKRSQLESGHFQLRRDMSYGAVLDVLTSRQGSAPQIMVTIPEGLSRTEIAAVARRAGVTGDYKRASIHSHVLKPSAYGAPAGAHTLEGFLFPATYDLLPGDPASKLVNAQLAAFKTNLAKVDLRRARSKRLSTYEVLTIASMVEREAQLASERPLIAAVIYNRLHDGMPLGIDATIRYAIGDYIRPLTASELALPSPYNTRLHKGLPPTPIGNPGLASIEASAQPAAVTYLYYVVKPGTCGHHAFSSSFTQFQQDVARYNSARAAKGGNSPTTCGH